jgi:PilZ domain
LREPRLKACPARRPNKASSEASPQPMTLDGRIEKRVPLAVPVYLMAAEDQFSAEKAITVNVSPHGARVVTKRKWQAEERPWLAPVSSEFRLQANVVYCQPLTDLRFCVGLKFRASVIDWGNTLWGAARRK